MNTGPISGNHQHKPDDAGNELYLDQIRNILSERACIRKPLLRTDELLAREWHAQGITIEHIRQAVLMGCGRKYISWRNGGPHTPIGSLAYFQPILEELKEEKAPAEYWEFIRERIERTEKLWISGHDPDRFSRPCPPAGDQSDRKEVSRDWPGSRSLILGCFRECFLRQQPGVMRFWAGLASTWSMIAQVRAPPDPPVKSKGMMFFHHPR